MIYFRGFFWVLCYDINKIGGEISVMFGGIEVILFFCFYLRKFECEDYICYGYNFEFILLKLFIDINNL